MLIHPEILVTPDYPVVKIREPRETVDLALVLVSVLRAQGWGLGTIFRVQFVNHERTKLLAMADFVVTDVTESLQTSEADPYSPRTTAVAARKFAQLGAWWEAAAPSDAVGAPAVRWNPGKQAHEVVTASGEVLATFTKDDGGKAAAEAFAKAPTTKAA